MEQLEKVEKLRERANVTYEEAKEALEASNWDLLDAMVYLEKNGKTQGPARETYSTSYEEQTQYVSVKDKVQEQKESEDNIFRKLGRLVGIVLRKCRDNALCIKRKGEEILRVPIILVVIAMILMWQILVPAIIVCLFLGCQYSFEGKDNLDEANRVMEQASKMADKAKDEFKKL